MTHTPSPLRITLVQAHLHWEDAEANLAAFEARLAPLAGHTDLVVLPEMFTTGFTMNARACAEPMDGRTLAWMRAQAKRLDAAVTGSFIVQEEGRCYNRLAWVTPDGACQHYDKRHLFRLAGEDKHYAPGTAQLIVHWRGWRIMPLVCYDLRFPAWSRNTMGYDLLLYVANFPAKRRHAWQHLLIARAIENQAYTIGVNRVGEDAHGIAYTGDSMLLDFNGQTRCHLAEQEACVTLSLDHTAQQAFRQQFDFLADQDAFSLH